MGVLKTPEYSKEERFFKEIMNTNEKLQDALTYSDRSMLAVKDMFGDDPKKYRGFPNITCAPAQNRSSATDGMLPMAFMKEPALGNTGLDILSNSIMGETALNDTSDLDKDKKDQNNNIVTFRDVASERTKHDTETKHSEQTVRTQTTTSSSAVAQHSPYTSQSKDPFSGINDDVTNSSRVSSTRSTSLASAPDMKEQNPQHTAFDVNTAAPTLENKIHSGSSAKMTTSQRDESKTFVKPKPVLQGTSFKGLQDLRQMVDNLEDEVRKYEIETGRDQCSPNVGKKEKESFGGFTASILNAVTKLVGYLRDCETQRKVDFAMKEEIFVGFQQQQILIDALTNDVLYMQEENTKLCNELETSRKSTDRQITSLKRELYAILKTREYQTLSEDIDFLYDINSTNSTNTHQTKNKLSKVPDAVEITNDHGLRDGFEYLPSGTSNKEVPAEGTVAQFNNSILTAPPLLQDTTSRTGVTTQRLQNASTTLSQHNGDINPASQQTSTRGTGTVKPRLEGGTAGDKYCGNENMPRYEREFPVPCDDGSFISPSKIRGTSGISTSKTTRSSNNVTRSDCSPSTTVSPPCDVLRDDNQAGVNRNVFLGRNQSMSPHRHLSDVFVRDGEHRRNVKTSQSGIKETTSKIDSTGERQAASLDEMSRLTLNDATHSDPEIRTHFSSADDIPFHQVYSSSQSQASPTLTPVFYERQPHLGLQNGGGKVVVTLPSMWEDARISPQQAVVSEQRFFAPVTSNATPVTRQKSHDKGWFALSSHVDYS